MPGIKDLAELVPLEASLLGLWMAKFSLCLHMVFSLYLLVSKILFIKDTNYIDLGFTLIASF